MDAGPMIDVCYRLQNPELFKGDVAWVPYPNLAEVTSHADRPEDTPHVSTWCAACDCDHTQPVEVVPQ